MLLSYIFDLQRVSFVRKDSSLSTLYGRVYLLTVVQYLLSGEGPCGALPREKKVSTSPRCRSSPHAWRPPNTVARCVLALELGKLSLSLTRSPLLALLPLFSNDTRFGGRRASGEADERWSIARGLEATRDSAKGPWGPSRPRRHLGRHLRDTVHTGNSTQTLSKPIAESVTSQRRVAGSANDAQITKIL